MDRGREKNNFVVESSSEREESEIPLEWPREDPRSKEATKGAIAGGSGGSTRV